MRLFSEDFWLYVTNVTITYVIPFFERLNWNSIFECFDDLHVWISDESIHVRKHESKAYMKAKHTWKQSIQAYKNHVFADPVYIFIENGSK